jgi:hypothetical protein
MDVCESLSYVLYIYLQDNASVAYSYINRTGHNTRNW